MGAFGVMNGVNDTDAMIALMDAGLRASGAVADSLLPAGATLAGEIAFRPFSL